MISIFVQSAVGFEYKGEVQQHGSQKGMSAVLHLLHTILLLGFCLILIIYCFRLLKGIWRKVRSRKGQSGQGGVGVRLQGSD